MNQSELEANTCNRRQARENGCELAASKIGLVLFLLLIGRESGAKFARENAASMSRLVLVLVLLLIG